MSLTPSSSPLDHTLYTLLPNGDRFFEQLLTDIRLARQSIDIEVYKFGCDFLCKRFAQALIQAQARKVRVRLIVDAIGTLKFGNPWIRAMRKAGIQIRAFHPLPCQPHYFKIACVDTKDRWPLWLRSWLTMNQRTHRKLFIIDNHCAYIGSMNINAKSLSKRLGGLGWREFAIRFNGIHIEALRRVFDATWHGQASHRHDHTWSSLLRTPHLRLAVGQRLRLRNYRNLLRQLASARQRIWIAQAYVAPLPSFIRAITKAAKRDVEIIMIRPRRCDSWLSTAAAWLYYRTLLKHGVQIHEYSHNMYHCKCLLIDDHAIIGSSNLNHRSLLHDLEIDITLNSPQLVAQLEEQFQEDMTKSSPITNRRGFKVKLLHWLSRLLKPFHYWL